MLKNLSLVKGWYFRSKLNSLKVLQLAKVFSPTSSIRCYIRNQGRQVHRVDPTHSQVVGPIAYHPQEPTALTEWWHLTRHQCEPMQLLNSIDSRKVWRKIWTLQHRRHQNVEIKRTISDFEWNKKVYWTKFSIDLCCIDLTPVRVVNVQRHPIIFIFILPLF